MGTNTANEDLAQDPTTLRFLNAVILGTSQPDIVNEDMGTEGSMSMIYSMSFKATSFYNMAIQVSPDSSLENSHGAIHVAIGDPYGHMSQLSHSAFDLIFWLHHANVDRHFIIWQAIYPNVWMLPESDLICNFTIAPGGHPGHRMLLATRTLGYSYASVPDTIITNATELSANVTANINVLYNPEGVFSSPKRKRDENREWSVAIQALSKALGERSTIRLYTEDSTPVVSFMCCHPLVANGGNPPGLTYQNGFTSVDAVKAVGTSDIDDVGDYLKANLRWTVKKMDGTVLPTEQVSSLLITVQDEIVTHPAVETELPVYGTKTLHPEITSGKAGGASS
ncbi:hypothetical protein BPAE_0153g00050 [Botrytis paeoniae]|uniref:tyrosinase n=1 Tax=Botrytis paeoniae TaxID=278948 RepID=A0A4Z1FHV4_9HELO|nr:hypothetical protein BPAE_0153g00050 [Botrytis paeoniae]